MCACVCVLTRVSMYVRASVCACLCVSVFVSGGVFVGVFVGVCECVGLCLCFIFANPDILSEDNQQMGKMSVYKIFAFDEFDIWKVLQQIKRILSSGRVCNMELALDGGITQAEQHLTLSSITVKYGIARKSNLAILLLSFSIILSS